MRDEKENSSSSASPRPSVQELSPSSPRRNNRSHHVRTRSLPIATPQMQVLGRDGRDLPIMQPSLSSSSAARNHPSDSHYSRKRSQSIPTQEDAYNSSSSSWWNRRRWTWKSRSSDTEETNCDDNNDKTKTVAYSSLAEQTRNEGYRAASPTVSSPSTGLHPTVSPHPLSLLSTEEHTAVTHESTTLTGLLSQENTNSNRTSIPSFPFPTMNRYSQIPPLSQRAQLEEEVRDESSFFYRLADEEQEMIAPSSDYNTTYHLHHHQQLLPDRQRSAYRARYQQLNQEYYARSDDFASHDLELALDGDPGDMLLSATITGAPGYYVTYPDQHGGQTFPHDKVRLVMDSELEPGILSVYQTGKARPTTSRPQNGDVGDDLRYALTVPPDLYRRMISEISDSYTMRLYHLTNAHNEEHVSIVVAIGILGVVFLVLFVNTIIWPVD